jgi:hypothetical protein
VPTGKWLLLTGVEGTKFAHYPIFSLAQADSRWDSGYTAQTHADELEFTPFPPLKGPLKTREQHSRQSTFLQGLERKVYVVLSRGYVQ